MEYTQFTETRWFRMANGNKLWSQSPLILAYYMRELSGPRVSFAIARPLSRRKQFRLISSSIKRNTTRACRIGFSMRFQANIYISTRVRRKIAWWAWDILWHDENEKIDRVIDISIHATGNNRCIERRWELTVRRWLILRSTNILFRDFKSFRIRLS